MPQPCGNKHLPKHTGRWGTAAFAGNGAGRCAQDTKKGNMDNRDFQSIDEYIAQFPSGIAQKLQSIREQIQQAVPLATERISYRMPTFYLYGNLVHFAAFSEHIGFFPGASGVAAFLPELTGYSVSKGTIRFPLHQPVPYDLIRRIAVYRAQENSLRQRNKKKR